MELDPNYSPQTEIARKSEKTLVVNLGSGAGAGKSTTACTLQGIFKMHGITSEYTGEHAKDMAWDGRLKLKRNDVHMFAEQHNRQFRLDGQVDCIITDSPLFLTSVYKSPQDKILDALVMQEFNKYDNITFYIVRKKEFIARGREGDIKDAQEIDTATLDFLNNNNIPYTKIDGTWEGINQIAEMVLERLNVKQLYKICKI